MKLIAFIFILLISFSCENKTEKKESLVYFDKEISNRMEVLKIIVLEGDSLKTKATLIDEEVSHLILLSKDVENLSASVNRGNAFFDALAAEFGLQLKDFSKLNTGMHVDEIELILKQNELNLFNQIIIKISPGKNTLYTAQ